jgi:predicted nucleotidyltransferase
MNETDHPVTAQACARFVSALSGIEADHDVKVLYACESGSRAWGFASPDSDYDVRFIYASRRSWYLAVFEARDVIELPLEGDEDINGWDLRKALRLLAKSNPVLLEWLQSPIVYKSDTAFHAGLRELAARFHSPTALHYHYFHMARKNFREHLLGEEVKLKKYFYVLRPVLACQWIERGYGVPPMAFMSLVERLLPAGVLLDTIRELRGRKMQTAEFGASARITAIHDFLEAELMRLGRNAPLRPEEPVQHKALDDFLGRWAAQD